MVNRIDLSPIKLTLACVAGSHVQKSTITQLRFPGYPPGAQCYSKICIYLRIKHFQHMYLRTDTHLCVCEEAFIYSSWQSYKMGTILSPFDKEKTGTWGGTRLFSPRAHENKCLGKGEMVNPRGPTRSIREGLREAAFLSVWGSALLLCLWILGPTTILSGMMQQKVSSEANSSWNQGC